jgi:hypothetical protein
MQTGLREARFAKRISILQFIFLLPPFMIDFESVACYPLWEIRTFREKLFLFNTAAEMGRKG